MGLLAWRQPNHFSLNYIASQDILGLHFFARPPGLNMYNQDLFLDPFIFTRFHSHPHKIFPVNTISNLPETSGLFTLKTQIKFSRPTP